MPRRNRKEPAKTAPALAKSESQELDEDLARLEAENAEMEAKLKLSSRSSYIAAEPPSLATMESATLDEDIARLEAENAAMEAKLMLKSRASYVAAGEQTTDEEESSGTGSEEAMSPPPVAIADVATSGQPVPSEVRTVDKQPLMEMLAKVLGGFCIPCKAMQAQAA